MNKKIAVYLASADSKNGQQPEGVRYCFAQRWRIGRAPTRCWAGCTRLACWLSWQELHGGGQESNRQANTRPNEMASKLERSIRSCPQLV